MRTVAVLALVSISLPAMAQEGRRSARDLESEIVREVERGMYIKANLGSTIYMNTHGVARPTGAPLLAGVMSTGIGIGSDFIDRESFSAAWEVQLGQGLFNGPKTEELVAPLAQGDIHTISGTAAFEVSTYVSRRLGLGLRGGGGVMMIPLLMAADEYNNTIVPAIGGPARLHEGPLPLAMGGPTLEYYTKLSHFSLGADVDISYVIGFDLGIYPSGYLKYTF